MLDKFDKKWAGFVLGIFLPAFCFFCYWLFFSFPAASFVPAAHERVKNHVMCHRVTISSYLVNE